MKQLLRFSFLQFWRNTFLRTLYFCLLLLLNGYALYAWVGNPFNGVGTIYDPMAYLHAVQGIGILFYIFFLFVSYVYFYDAEHVHLTEAFQATRGGVRTARAVQLLLLLIGVTIPFCNLLLWNLVVCAVQHTMAVSYLVHAFLAYLLDFFLPGVIALLLGMALSYHKKRLSAYAAILLLLFLALPISARIPALLSGADGSSIYPYRLFDLFLLQPYDIKYAPTYGYGVPMERYRWMIVLFWLFLLAAVLLWRSRREISRRTVCVAGCVCLAASLCFFGLSLHRNCYQYDGQRADSTMMFDQVYMLDNPDTVNQTQPAGFRVEQYDMALTVTDQLKADVTLRLSYDVPPDAYRFTLQRTMRIDAVTDAGSNPLPYQQSGNYLEIKGNGEAPLTQIHIRYHGYDNNFYTNWQGVSLPAYYPYYPMPGYHACYDLKTRTYSADYPRTDSLYHVRVNSRLPLMSNLPKTEKNTFSGTAQGLTLKGGFQSEEMRAGVRLIYPTYQTELTQDVSLLSDLDAVLTEWNDLLGSGLAYSLAGKTIVLDETNYASENGAIYGDHLLVSSIRNAQQIAVELLRNTLPDSPKKIDLQTLFLRDLQTGHAIADSVKFSAQGDQYASLAVPIQEKIDRVGRAVVMRQLYQYLLDETDQSDPLDRIAAIS